MYYPMNIAGVERQLPICRVNDDLYIAGFVILGDIELTVKAAEALNKLAPDYDYAITAESKGIPLLHEMTRQCGRQKYILARKKSKLYMSNPYEHKVQSITTEGEQTLYLDGEDMELMKGKRILIVDDVISTGASLEALEDLVKAAGGNIVGKMTILAEGDAADRDDIIYLEKLPLFNADGTQK